MRCCRDRQHGGSRAVGRRRRWGFRSDEGQKGVRSRSGRRNVLWVVRNPFGPAQPIQSDRSAHPDAARPTAGPAGGGLPPGDGRRAGAAKRCAAGLARGRAGSDDRRAAPGRRRRRRRRRGRCAARPPPPAARERPTHHALAHAAPTVVEVPAGPKWDATSIVATWWAAAAGGGGSGARPAGRRAARAPPVLTLPRAPAAHLACAQGRSRPRGPCHRAHQRLRQPRARWVSERRVIRRTGGGQAAAPQVARQTAARLSAHLNTPYLRPHTHTEHPRRAVPARGRARRRAGAGARRRRRRAGGRMARGAGR
jgi:hypothetical protein